MANSYPAFVSPEASKVDAERGRELAGQGPSEGLWADRTVGLDGVRSDIAMMRTPDGHGKLELTKYRTPETVGAGPENPPPNTLGRTAKPA